MKMVNEAAKRAALRVDEATARAEKAEADYADLVARYRLNDIAIVWRKHDAMKERAEKAEAELARARRMDETERWIID
jgi:hypothetical protein